MGTADLDEITLAMETAVRQDRLDAQFSCQVLRLVAC